MWSSGRKPKSTDILWLTLWACVALLTGDSCHGWVGLFPATSPLEFKSSSTNTSTARSLSDGHDLKRRTRTLLFADATKKEPSKKQKKNAAPAQEVPLEDVIGQVEAVRLAAVEEIDAADDEKALNDVRVKYLGKKGPLQSFMAMMRSLSSADKPKLGAVVNKAKEEVEGLIAARRDSIEGAAMNSLLAEEYIDVSIDGLDVGGMSVGHRHPLSLTTEKATNIFRALGYDVVSGAAESPEIEEDYYCFTALNCPLDHPARDMQDTFYIEDSVDADGNPKLLRTHTSAVQIREMEKRVRANDIPFRIVAPGRGVPQGRDRRDALACVPQIEILTLDEKGKLSVNHLKGTIEYFLKQMFGSEIDVRYRGSYFPFTEPSMEVDVFYKGRWLEVLGCGMVDPRVLRLAGVDPEKYGGFAAGFGVERFAMVTYGIPDIRLFYNGDLRFLEQFPSVGFELGDDQRQGHDRGELKEGEGAGDASSFAGDLFLGLDTPPVHAEAAFAVQNPVEDEELDFANEEAGEADNGLGDDAQMKEEPLYPLEGMEADWEASLRSWNSSKRLMVTARSRGITSSLGWRWVSERSRGGLCNGGAPFSSVSSTRATCARHRTLNAIGFDWETRPALKRRKGTKRVRPASAACLRV